MARENLEAYTRNNLRNSIHHYYSAKRMQIYAGGLSSRRSGSQDSFEKMTPRVAFKQGNSIQYPNLFMSGSDHQLDEEQASMSMPSVYLRSYRGPNLKSKFLED